MNAHTPLLTEDDIDEMAHKAFRLLPPEQHVPFLEAFAEVLDQYPDREPAPPG